MTAIMGKKGVKLAAILSVSIAAIATGMAIFVYSGAYEVAATTPHFKFTSRVLRTVKERSLARQARNVEVPELDDPQKVHAGLRSFQEMCVVCHGAPGEPATQLSKGLYPKAPDLARAVKAWTPAEQFVIIRNGLKMTGMPAWGPTHSDEDIWAIVAFLKIFPSMPQTEYREAVAYYDTYAPSDTPGMSAGHH